MTTTHTNSAALLALSAALSPAAYSSQRRGNQSRGTGVNGAVSIPPGASSQRRHLLPAALVVGGLFAGQGQAQTVTIEPSDDGYVITHNNTVRQGGNEEVFTLATPHGDVTVTVENTWNADCPGLCPDTMQVTDWPEGWIATPSQVVTPENDRREIRLAPYLGG